MKTGIKIIFTVSLLLNVLLLGVVGGHVYAQWKDHPWQDVREELSPEARNHAARIFQSAFRKIREVGDEARKARGELVKILSAETFDAKAFDKEAAKLAEARAEITTLKIAATKEVAMALDAQERAKMAQRMTDMIGGGWEKRVHRDHRPMGMMSPVDESGKPVIPPLPEKKPEK